MNWIFSAVNGALDQAIRLVEMIHVGEAIGGAPVASVRYVSRPSSLILDEFRRSMIRLRTREDCQAEILRFAREIFNTEHAGLLLWDEEKGMFVDRQARPGVKNEWNIFDPLFLFLSDNDRVLRREDLDAVQSYGDRQSIRDFMDATGAGWVLPLVLNETVLAVLFVGEGRTGDRPDPALLEDFRSYGVLSLSNSIIYTRVESLLLSLEDKVRERTRQLEEATNQMIQSEKMVTLGVMVAGVAHELNTPSGVILNATQNLLENLESLLDRLLEAEWLRTPEMLAEFAGITRFFNYHLLTGNLSVPKNAFHLRKAIADSLMTLRVVEPENLAAFFAEFGFFGDEHPPDVDAIRQRLAGEHLIAMIVNLYGRLDEAGRESFLSYLRDVAGIYRNARNIGISGASIARLVKALRVYSRSGKGDAVTANLEELLESTLEILESIWKHNAEVRRNFKKLPLIECDPDSLNQVWSNLLLNAYQASRENEHPQLTVSAAPDPEGQHVVVSVRDNGKGIPEAIREKIWDPFFTTKEPGEGTGLGLSIVRRIVEEHGGIIRYETGADGTEFFVRLPVHRGQDVAPEPPSSTLFGRYDWRG